MEMSSRRGFLERIIAWTLGGTLAVGGGGIAYVMATRPPFPDYIFHGNIGGEHIALYRGRTTPIQDLRGYKNPDLLLGVTMADETATDAHPAIYNDKSDIVTNFMLEQPMNRSKHPTIFYMGKGPNEFYGAEIVENGIRKGPVDDMTQARIKFAEYLRRIHDLNPDASF